MPSAPTARWCCSASVLSLQQDITDHPERLQPITADLAGRLQELVGRIEVNLDAPLPDDGDYAGELATGNTV
jgi:hypothetical protein